MLHTARKCRIEKRKWNLKENKFSIAFKLYYFVRSTTKNRTMKNIVYILVCASVIFSLLVRLKTRIRKTVRRY